MVPAIVIRASAEMLDSFNCGVDIIDPIYWQLGHNLTDAARSLKPGVECCNKCGTFSGDKPRIRIQFSETPHGPGPLLDHEAEEVLFSREIEVRG